MQSDDPRLPPGQTWTRKFPVVGEKAPLAEALDPGRWRLVVSGLVERPLELDLEELRTHLGRERVADLHCVTGWSRRATRLGGGPLAGLLAEARPRPEARFVRFEAWSARGHDTTLPLDVARDDTWLVDRVDGAALASEHGGPLRAVTPSRYLYKSLKWLRRIELLAEDRRGYWERSSAYHDRGDPWAGNERFRTGSIAPERLEELRQARDFRPWRGPRHVLLGLDLRGWVPGTRDLGDLHLKGCDLREAGLEGVWLRSANLSLSDLRGARLSGACLRGADLEGANLAGADLSGADLTETSLCATRFVELDPTGAERAARVDGLRIDGAGGLLEDAAAWLRARGVSA